jgi:hypothetical protein
MVVEDVHDPDLGLVGEEEPGGVDLPQIVGRGPLETLGGGPGPSPPRCHQVVARERTMDRRDRRRTDPLSAQLGADPPRPPLGVFFSEGADDRLDVGGHALGLSEGHRRAGLEPLDSLGAKASEIDVIGLPRDPETAADGRHGLSTLGGFSQHLKAQIGH